MLTAGIAVNLTDKEEMIKKLLRLFKLIDQESTKNQNIIKLNGEVIS